MTAPQPLVNEYLPFEALVYRTRTGEVLGSIPLAEQIPTWERGLNMSGSWTANPTLDTSVLKKSELSAWIEAWDMSWAICQGNRIWQAGPVIGERYTDGQNSTQILGVGIWQLLTDKRTLFNPTRAAVDIINGVDADVSFGTTAISDLGAPIPLANRDLSIRGVAKRIVEIILTEPGGDLPIDIVSTGSFAGTTAQNYPGYEVGSPGNRLEQLTQLVDGLEIEFEAYFTSPQRTFVRHLMKIGEPRLGQLGFPHVWATGLGLVDCGYSYDGTNKVRRDWERGQGMDRNILTGFSQNLDGVTTGLGPGLLPLLEEVGSTHMNAADGNTLTSYAQASVITNTRGMKTLAPVVRLDGTLGDGRKTGSPDLRDVAPGDTGYLDLTEHPRLEDGRYAVRIVRMRGDSDTQATMDVNLL